MQQYATLWDTLNCSLIIREYTIYNLMDIAARELAPDSTAQSMLEYAG